MSEQERIAHNTERFEAACADLAGALERFADLASQVARDFRTTTNIVKTAMARPQAPAA